MGKFILGIWTDYSEVTLNSFKLADPMISLAQKSIRIRQEKCREIADRSSKNL